MFKPLGLVVGLFITGILIYLAISFVLGQVSAFMVRQEYGERIATICTTPGGGATSMANAPKVPKPWRALVLDGNKKHGSNGDLPDDAQADGPDAIDVVVCVSEKRKSTVEECKYRSRKDGTISYVDRKQYYHDLVVLNAETGLRIASLRVWGSAPNPCPQTYYGGTRDELTGGSPPDEQFYYVIMDFIWR